MRFADLLDVDRVTTSLQASDKDGVLRALAKLFSATSELDEDEVFRVFAEREALASTGVGSGVAIPHGRIAGLERLQAALGVHPTGVSFDSVDGRPVHIFVAVLAPERQPSEHLKALARISRLLRDERVREALRNAADPQSAYDVVTLDDGSR
ncbi:MAG: PTS sugar transporter subunit IIA [Myxococcota bacterium]